MSYFQDKNKLNEATGKSLDPLKVTERYGAGIISSKGVAKAKSVGAANNSLGWTERFDRDEGNLETGQQMFTPGWETEQLDITTLQVYKNGQNLVLNQDYQLSSGHDHIILRHGIGGLDDDLEVRVEYLNAGTITVDDVLLLPRYDMSDKELESFYPEPYDIFHVDRLLKHENPHLMSYKGMECKALSVYTDKDGIKAMVKIVD